MMTQKTVGGHHITILATAPDYRLGMDTTGGLYVWDNAGRSLHTYCGVSDDLAPIKHPNQVLFDALPENRQALILGYRALKKRVNAVKEYRDWAKATNERNGHHPTTEYLGRGPFIDTHLGRNAALIDWIWENVGV